MSYKVGDFVQFISKEMHEIHPEIFPPVGTVGEITIEPHGVNGCVCQIKWSCYPLPLFCNVGWIESVVEGDDEAIEEIDIMSLIS